MRNFTLTGLVEKKHLEILIEVQKMISEKEAKEIALKWLRKKHNLDLPVKNIIFVEGNPNKKYYGKYDEWSISFQLHLEWDPNEIIVTVNAETGKAEGFPTL
jgi:Peptidase propeptide and YPEB domain